MASPSSPNPVALPERASQRRARHRQLVAVRRTATEATHDHEASDTTQFRTPPGVSSIAGSMTLSMPACSRPLNAGPDYPVVRSRRGRPRADADFRGRLRSAVKRVRPGWIRGHEIGVRPARRRGVARAVLGRESTHTGAHRAVIELLEFGTTNRAEKVPSPNWPPDGARGGEDVRSAELTPLRLV